MPNYKDTIKKKIIKHINQTSIAGFIIKEIDSNLSFFNPFRLENIMENIDIFSAFINELDTHNTKLYTGKQRHNKITDKKNIIPYKENKYISKCGRETLSIQEQKKFNKLTFTEKNQNTTLIKGRFLLSIADFAQGSNCRVQNKYQHKIGSQYNI